MEWWLWVSGGFVLMALELFAPTGFFIFLFGAAAALVGGYTAITTTDSFIIQCCLFAALSVVLVVLARKKLMACVKRNTPSTGVDVVGAEVEITHPIAPGEFGQGILTGSNWTVKNATSSVLKAGTRPKVSRVDGVTLIIS